MTIEELRYQDIAILKFLEMLKVIFSINKNKLESLEILFYLAGLCRFLLVWIISGVSDILKFLYDLKKNIAVIRILIFVAGHLKNVAEWSGYLKVVKMTDLKLISNCSKMLKSCQNRTTVKK